MTDRQAILDRFYFQHGPCCAGCDWWRHVNGNAGECTRSAPVEGHQRMSMFGISGCTIEFPAGHIITPREHVCGDFKDEFDWSTLPLVYLKRVGAPDQQPHRPRRSGKGKR